MDFTKKKITFLMKIKVIIFVLEAVSFHDSDISTFLSVNNSGSRVGDTKLQICRHAKVGNLGTEYPDIFLGMSRHFSEMKYKETFITFLYRYQD